MTPNEYLEETRARLRRDGNEVAEVEFPDGPVVVGTQSKFRLRWLATKLHLFTVVACEPNATAELLARLTDDSLIYAVGMKGSFQGLGSGVGVIPALVSEHVLPDARQLAERRPAKHFAAFALPIVIDLSGDATYSYAGQIWGSMAYLPWARKRIAATLPPPTAQS
jgi:hypothetical protein